MDCIRQAFVNLAIFPAAPIDKIDIIPPEIRNRLLVTWNGRTVPYSKERTILQLIEEQAAATPSNPAVTFTDITLSYRSLNGKANTLATRLQEKDITKGDLIPFIMNNCLEIPIAVLALMKLGAVFVPIDLSWPTERIRALVDKINPKLVVYSESNPVFHQLGVSTMAVSQADLVEQDENLELQLDMKDLIYGFFTSGSTGIPKCALNIHLGLLNRFLYMSRRYQSNGNDIVLQNSKHVFDSSIWQMFWPLTNGSQVVIPPPSKLLDLSKTIEIIAKNKITMTDFVPSIFNAMVNLLKADPAIAKKLQSLRQLLIGGEEISPKAVHTFKAILPHIGITNTFGPTEASIGCVFHEVVEADSQSIPIGRPIDNTYAVLLDEKMNLCPPGAIGEIYIAGDCLGVGYLNDPEKTEAAFFNNSYQEIPGERLYRTGDLAYYRFDGLLQFVGRKDSQVKIGGVRIELSELESVMASHPQVCESKIVVDGETDNKRLLAFVVAEGGLEVATLRQYMEQRLPTHSVPKQFFFLETMPLNHNGKIDRKALKQMVQEVTNNNSSTSKETLSLEENVIASVWRQILKINSIDVNEDLFANGGDSLLALSLSLNLEKLFKVKLSVQDVFNSPTIQEQAKLLSNRTDNPNQTVSTHRQYTDLATEVELNCQKVLNFSPNAIFDHKQNQPKNIFLTGSTGFIGAQLLSDLLTSSNAKVFCLLRGKEQMLAYQHLCNNLKHYNLWQDDFASRIFPVIGDLSKPDLGLLPGQFSLLADIIDIIIHNGAMVNFLHDYSHLRNVNVSGTVEILKLATVGKHKWIHYISSLSIFPINKSVFTSKITEETEPFDRAIPEGGYNQSKWVSEKILWQARKNGVPITIYRLGEVMPNSHTGVPNVKALFDLLIRVCVKLRLSFPHQLRLDYTPVDYVSRFIITSVNNSKLNDSCFHLFHPDGILFDELLQRFYKLEFELRKVSYAEFWTILRENCVQNQEDKDFLSLLSLLPERNISTDIQNLECSAKLTELLPDNTLYFSCTKTQAMLHEWNIDWPLVDRHIFDVYATWYAKQSVTTNKPLVVKG